MAEDLVRDMDAETLRDLMQTMQGLAPEPGDTPPPPPADLARQLADMDPETLRKIAEAAAGLEPPPGAERPELSPELQDQLAQIDPATREKLQRALEGLQREPAPRPQTGRAPAAGQAPGPDGQASGADGRAPGPDGQAPSPQGEARAEGETPQGAPAPDGQRALAAGGEGEPGAGGRPLERRILLPSQTEVSVGEAGDGPAQATRDGDARVEATGERATVSFGEIPDTFREQAEAALSRQRVPESYERVVREYFRPQQP